MKTLIQRLVFFTAILMGSILNFAFADNTQPVIFACPDIPNYPYETGSGEKIDWKKPGVNLEILKLVEAKLGKKFVFMRLPWRRGLYSLSHGKIDGLFGASFKKKRLKDGRYPMKNGVIDETRMFFELSYVLFKQKDSKLEWDGSKIKNLTDKGIGVVLGYSIGVELTKMGVKVFESKTDLANMQRLTKGHLDGVAGFSVSGNAILTKYPAIFNNIIEMSPSLNRKPYYLMLSHQFYNKHEELAEKIWDTIATCRDSEEVKKIYEKYVD